MAQAYPEVNPSPKSQGCLRRSYDFEIRIIQQGNGWGNALFLRKLAEITQTQKSQIGIDILELRLNAPRQIGVACGFQRGQALIAD